LLLLLLTAFLTASLGPRRLSFAAVFLFELLDLPRQELLRDRVLLAAQLVVSAVWTPFPAFGVRLFAGRAEDALR
jgi:hypothetical protein